jgi:hypothetical protein
MPEVTAVFTLMRVSANRTLNNSRDFAMLWTTFAILLILWLLGFGYHIGGAFVHLLLVAAVLALIVNIWRPNTLHRR